MHIYQSIKRIENKSTTTSSHSHKSQGEFITNRGWSRERGRGNKIGRGGG